ncbi:ribonuclease P/MRP protein subunit POP5-like [Liolophura sinensis]|uniref:ribonuclease P/MRP protein subunit POP5-like n=1 Tax=Liolophura sinensis TaxID=3198878 RepID=UPI00315947BF
MRFKKRYLLCEIIYADRLQIAKKVTGKDVYYSVKQMVQKAHGDYGMGALQISLAVKYFNAQTNMVIFRADRAFYKLLMSALALTKELFGQEACFHTLHVSGTIRSCHKFLVKHHRQQLPLMLAQCTTEEEKDKLRQIIHGIDKRQASLMGPVLDPEGHSGQRS